MSNVSAHLQPYIKCIGKQLEEVDLLASIYCTPGEFHIYDASVISDFNDFLLATPSATVEMLRSYLEYSIKLNIVCDDKDVKLDVRVQLPHLYPLLEHAVAVIHTPLLTKAEELHFKTEVERYIASLDKEDAYIFQLLNWIQEQFEVLLKTAQQKQQQQHQNVAVLPAVETHIEFERLWIYSHHIKSKTKRHEILKQARNLDLSGFSRPGKPGIICVEGLAAHVQEFWQCIRAMHWQKISICKSEPARKPLGNLDALRRFEGFHEQLFGNDADNENCVMNMGQFIKFLETHQSGYMKQELFGLT